MQWRLVFKDDIEELRSTLASHVATINLLLMTQSLSSILAAEQDRVDLTREMQSQILHNRKILQNVECVVRESVHQQGEAETQLRNQAIEIGSLKAKVEIASSQLQGQKVVDHDLQSAVSATSVQSTSILSATTDVLNSITSGALKLQVIPRQLIRNFELLTTFTTEMRTLMAKLLQAFGSLRSSIQRIEDSLPLKIDFPILQFTDALGETMALPLQLCQSWTTFQELLKVAFIGKPGKLRIDSGRYVIMQARGGRVLTEGIWENMVKRNDHLLMAIVLNVSLTGPEDFCPFPSCRASVRNAEIKSGGQICPRCFRWARLTPLELFEKSTTLPSTSGDVFEDSDGTLDEPNQEEETKEVELYQNIQASTVNHDAAISYVKYVKGYFVDRPEIYRHFLCILNEMENGKNDLSLATQKISTLCQGHPELIRILRKFLPQMSRQWTLRGY